MDLTIGVARVETADTVYDKALVRLQSVDDVTAEMTVSDRRGVQLQLIDGPLTSLGAGVWQVGDAKVEPTPGCGCGGTGVTSKL